jgi:hypothetical protein
MIIIFDISIKYYFCDYIEHFFFDKKLVLYYWNNINSVKENEIAYFKNTKWSIFSFDLTDCKKYQLKYNKIFSAVPTELCSSDKKRIKQEVFFIGTDKGRMDQIQQIKQGLNKLGISNKILCVKSGSSSKRDDIYADPIPYGDVLLEDMRSKAILDINYDDRYGMTMRELEALFLHKKLITNNKKIQERDFYNANNIFIIDYSKLDILEGLKEFLKNPFVPVDKKILESYSLSAWFERFLV